MKFIKLNYVHHMLNLKIFKSQKNWVHDRMEIDGFVITCTVNILMTVICIL